MDLPHVGGAARPGPVHGLGLMRAVVAGVLVLVALLAHGEAGAQDFSNCNNNAVTSGSTGICPDKASAVAAARAGAQSKLNWEYKTVCRNPALDTATLVKAWATWNTTCEATPNGYVYERSFPSGVLCADGGSWDAATETCGEPALTDEQCLALNAEPGFINSGPRSRTYTQQCLKNGCMWEVVADAKTALVNGFSVTSGIFEFTGACTAGTSAPVAEEETPATSQTCAPASGGQTFCLQSNGEHCYTASTGKQICWRAGETGTKTTDNVAQKRVAGSTVPTAPTPPEGETFAAGASTTVETTTNNVTITTTTTNFTTAGGTEAGPEDAGEPADGTGAPTGQADGVELECEGCDTSDGSDGHESDSIWGTDETLNFVGDESGLGFGTTCPAPPTLATLGGIQLDWAGMCQVLTYLGLLILAAAHMHALYILVEA